MDMRSFQHITPPLRLFSGADSLGQLGRELDRLNSRRAVIVCGGSLSRNSAVMDLLRSAMGDRCAGVFAGVQAHSPVPAVLAGAQELQRLQADAVVAIGGGSAIVTARAASILLAESGEVRALATSRDERGQLRSPRLNAPKLPQLVIPTTPNTATVKAGSAVFDPERGERLALFDPKTRAQCVFIHPELLATAPRKLVVTASLDTLTLALEGLMSRTGDPISDAMLMHAVRLLAEHLPNPALDDDPGARGELMMAAVLCGQGTDFTGAGMATVLGHAIGARHHVENGLTKAIALPAVLRFNEDAARPGLRKIATALGLPTTDDASMAAMIIDALEGIFGRLGIPRQLREVGVTQQDFSAIATNAWGDWFLRSNPRAVRDVAEVEGVLAAAW